jgi:hypothetical protein
MVEEGRDALAVAFRNHKYQASNATGRIQLWIFSKEK